MLDKSEVSNFVKDHLLGRIEYYDLYGQLDDLSGGAMIADLNIIDISYEDRVGERIDFFGTFIVEAIKDFGVARSSFTGTFRGYFDQTGIELESASLDIST